MPFFVPSACAPMGGVGWEGSANVQMGAAFPPLFLGWGGVKKGGAGCPLLEASLPATKGCKPQSAGLDRASPWHPDLYSDSSAATASLRISFDTGTDKPRPFWLHLRLPSWAKARSQGGGSLYSTCGQVQGGIQGRLRSCGCLPTSLPLPLSPSPFPRPPPSPPPTGRPGQAHRQRPAL